MGKQTQVYQTITIIEWGNISANNIEKIDLVNKQIDKSEIVLFKQHKIRYFFSGVHVNYIM